MAAGSERRVVQAPLLRYAEEVGWIYLKPDEVLRKRRGTTGPVLHEVLIDQLQRLNPGVGDHRCAEEIAARLTRVPPTIEGNLQAWRFLKGEQTVYVEEERRERNVRLLDPRHLNANTYHVTDEFTFASGLRTIRPDVVFLVNGIPVLLVETKAATRLDGIAEALEQVRRYHREAPELLALMQLHAVTQVVEFLYGATWNISRNALFNWRDERGTTDFETLVKLFVCKERLVRILDEFILFTQKDGELSKVVLRPHQMRAVERVISRARDPQRLRGLVWHTQGSGKTYTMITVAKRLLEDPQFENPTVLMLVDRTELQQQLFDNLGAVGFGTVHRANSKRDLQDLIRTDYRGLIVSMIHKFDGMPANLNQRTNIFVLVDEAHRTTGGDLGTHLMAALPNATFVGFTGTPIDKTAHGGGTFKVFGGGDPRGYLDKYTIRDSIRDGTTVPLHYAFAPNDLRVDRETLDREFLDLADAEAVSDVEELNRVLDRAVTLKSMLKNPERVARVAAFVAQHFREKVAPMGYKAFLVAVDRHACALYKHELDKHLPPEASRVVISAGHNDPEELLPFHLSEDEEEKVRKAFRKPDEMPQILIVTEKLLTGYDAPILYAMYLDKPMRDHVLLQAIARVNRPYEDAEGRAKSAGLIVDFVGIFERLERALAFDSADVAGVIEGIDVLQRQFERQMARGRAEYLPIYAGPSPDRAVVAVEEHFRDRAVRHEFYTFFRGLQELYEILSPDPFLRPFLDDYNRLAEMYRIARRYDFRVIQDRSFLRKTADLVSRRSRTDSLELDPGRVELDAATLERFAHTDQPEITRVLNLLKLFHRLAVEEGPKSPYLLPIGERAEAIAQAFDERQMDTREALTELEKLVVEYGEAEASRRESRFSTEAFAVFWLLRREGVAAAEPVATAIAAELKAHPHWRTAPREERAIRQGLLTALHAHGLPKERVTELIAKAISLLQRSSA